MPSPQSLPPAALWRRLAAAAYDLLLVLALLMVATALLIIARAGAAIDPGSLWYQLLLVSSWWLYFGWCWTHGGQTIGMRAWRLVLIDTQSGRSIGWPQAGLRFLAAALSALPAGLGFAWSLGDPEHRTWHDRLSRSALKQRARASAGAAPQAP